MTERLNLLSYRRNLRRRSKSKSDYNRWLGPSWAPISDRAAAESGAGGGRPPRGSKALRQYRQQFRGGRDGRDGSRANACKPMIKEGRGKAEVAGTSPTTRLT